MKISLPQNGAAIALLTGLFLLAGCVKPGVPTRPGAPAEKPRPEKIAGSVKIGADESFSVIFKEARIEIDPSSGADLERTDYVLLTRSDESCDNALTGQPRKDVKIITSAPAAQRLKKKGLTQVKALEAGQRIMLKKNEGFLFVSAVGSEAPGAYLLEFDNGRNIFVGTQPLKPDALREFVYSLRDDGREIYLALWGEESAGSQAAASAWSALIGWLSPRFAVFPVALQKLNRGGELEQALAADLYAGGLLFVRRGDEVPF